MIDIYKCMGCRRGIYPFIKEGDNWKHFGLFGEGTCVCQNSEEIKDLIYENKGHGTYLPNKEFLLLLQEQSNWYEDIVDLAFEIFKTTECIKDFFTSKDLWNKKDIEMENALVEAAINQNIIINEETYPFLIKNKIK